MNPISTSGVSASSFSILLALLFAAGCNKDDSSNNDNSSGSGGSGGSGLAMGGSGGAGGSSGGSGGASTTTTGQSSTGGAAGAPPMSVCGDGEIDDDEDCDGSNVGTETCEHLGLGPGPLGCKASCEFDLTGCAPGELCGNGQVDGAEQCDDGDANSDTEPDACRVNCTRASCGDSITDTGEGCDDGLSNSDFRADACRSDCSEARCGDGLIDSGEDCDLDKLGRATCAREGFSDGVLSCTESCTFDTSGCVICGDGVADGSDPNEPGYEECDTDDFRDQDCSDFGFVGGRLTCSECEIETTSCGDQPPACGNNQVEADETCDGTDLDGLTCADFGFAGGRLGCRGDCSDYNTSLCNSCGNGTIEGGEVCDDGNSVDDFTCSADCRYSCGVGYGECTGDTSRYCGFDRNGNAVIFTEQCDPIQGLSCTGGLCQGRCAVSALGSSYLGCDYYPTITNNSALVESAGDFGVTVSNSGTQTANVTVTMGGVTVATDTVAPGDVAVILLPWTTLRTSDSILVEDGAYRLRTDQPVTVYQYNPINYTKDGTFTYTNDASLLLPTNTWTGNYMVVARNSLATRPGIYAVVAKEDETQVTITPSATGGFVLPTAGVMDDGTGSVVLNEGDVLQIASDSSGSLDDPTDLTGTQIQADKPVQVIGGHECTNVPYSISACDHLEEAMLPIETLGSAYIVSPPLIDETTEKARMVRVIAVEADTTITYEPPQAGAPTTLTNVGDYFEIDQTMASFRIEADKRIMVAEYMLGQSAGGNTGDPAMVLAVPAEQFRTNYLFHAPTNYEFNFVNITAPTGSTITLDGVTLGPGTPVGMSGYSVLQLPLDNSGNGNHIIEATDRVGISVYGYGRYTSYWYPGGMELTQF